MKERKRYLVKVRTQYLDDGCVYRTRETRYETFAVSKKKAENNVRYRIIGNKYNTVDYQPYNECYSEIYEFDAEEL